MKFQQSESESKIVGSYETFYESPASTGVYLQFGIIYSYFLWNSPQSNDRHNWTELKNDVILYVLRNSVLIEPMPTASTSQILGYNECFEDITGNIYSRRILAGEFILTNKYFMHDLLII